MEADSACSSVSMAMCASSNNWSTLTGHNVLQRAQAVSPLPSTSLCASGKGGFLHFFLSLAITTICSGTSMRLHRLLLNTNQDFPHITTHCFILYPEMVFAWIPHIVHIDVHEVAF